MQLTFSKLFKFIFSTKDLFDDYEDYMQAFADRQTAYAKIKSLGVDSWISLVGMKSALNEAFQEKYLKSAYSI